MRKKGISLVSISIAVIVMLVLVSTISVSLTFSITNAKKMAFAKEIYNIQSLVDEYMERVSKVNKQNVVDVANKISVNTVYFLKN